MKKTYGNCGYIENIFVSLKLRTHVNFQTYPEYPMETSTPRSNSMFIIVAAIIAALSLIYGICNFYRAFPEMAIKMQISRHDALDSARVFLENRNFDLTDYKESIIFTGYWWSKNYLERELGVERTTSLAQDSIDIWYWRIRYFKPLEKLEYRVRVDPSGRIIGFFRLLPENDKGPSLEPETARILAEAFLTKQDPTRLLESVETDSVHIYSPDANEETLDSRIRATDLDKWEFIEESSHDRPNRRDHTFTYELKDFRAADAPYRLRIEVQGTTVSRFYRFLKVPQEWERDYDRERSQNDLFQNIADFLSFLTVVFIFIYFFQHIRRKQIPWKTAILIGIVLTTVKFIMGINSLPLDLAWYNTTESYGAFLGGVILNSFLGGLIEGMLVLLLIGAGEMLYRKDYPSKLALHNVMTKRGFKTREFIQATLMGYILVAFDIGFVVFYYIFGKKIGFWAPADIKYSNALSTMLPWIYPLAISMGAALLEEFWLRFFGISLFIRITKSTILAIIIPAFIWGFLHSSYPQSPGFVRGIEVGIIGILAGVVMLRFGIWATLVWHFVIDAVWIGLFLFRSDNAYFWISGLIVCGALLIPAVVAGVLYLKRRSFEPVDDLLNEETEAPPRWRIKKAAAEGIKAEPQVEPIPEATIKPTEVEPVAPVVPSIKPISKRTRLIGFICGIVGIILVLMPSPQKLSDEYKPAVTRTEAIEKAKAAVQERYGIDPTEYIITSVDDLNLFQESHMNQRFHSRLSYVFNNGAYEDARRIFFGSDGAGFLNWQVHFKREFDPESYGARIDQMTGKTSIWHTIPDSTVGAQLELDSARVLAMEAYEKAVPDTERFHLIMEYSKQRENRRDHFFNWETKEPVLEEAHIRTYASVKGDEVIASGSRSLKIPEEWERHEKEKTLRWTIIQALAIIMILGGAIFALITLGKRMVKRQIKWRAGLIAGGVIFVISILFELNQLPTFWWDYQTAEPTANFLTGQFLQMALGVIFISLMTIVVVSLAEAMVRGAYGVSPWPKPKLKVEKLKYSDNFFDLFGIILGLGWLLYSVTHWFGLPQHSFSLSLPETLAVYLPWYGEVASAITKSILGGSLLMIAFVMIRFGIKKTWLRWLILIVIAIVVAGIKELTIANLTSAELSWSVLQAIAMVSVLYLILKYLMPGRLGALIMGLYIITIYKPLALFDSWDGSPYQGQRWVLVAALIIPPLTALFWMIKKRKNVKV